MDDLTYDDCKLILSLIDNAIMPDGPQQRERIRAWVKAKQASRAPYAHIPADQQPKHMVRTV